MYISVPNYKSYHWKYELLCVYYLCFNLHAVLTILFLMENCCIYSFYNSFLPVFVYSISNFIRENNLCCVSHPSWLRWAGRPRWARWRGRGRPWRWPGRRGGGPPWSLCSLCPLLTPHCSLLPTLLWSGGDSGDRETLKTASCLNPLLPVDRYYQHRPISH